MPIYSSKFISFLYFVIILKINCNDKENDIVNIKKIEIIDEKKSLENKKIKNEKKVDISILREDLIHELIALLKQIQIKLEKLLKNSKKYLFEEQSQEIMKIFNWVNERIADFDEDPTLYGRDEIEIYLNQAQKYKLFLNNI
jgi:hypothetical protein